MYMQHNKQKFDLSPRHEHTRAKMDDFDISAWVDYYDSLGLDGFYHLCRDMVVWTTPV